MGYSVAITARSLKARNLILSFMNKEYRPWKELDKTYKVQNSFGPTNDLGYNDGLLKVGFNMSACDPEYTYIFTIIKWMALQVGRKQKVTKEVRKCDPNFEWPKLPYLVYDGYETWPIITNDVQNVPTDYKWAQVVVLLELLIQDALRDNLDPSIDASFAVLGADVDERKRPRGADEGEDFEADAL